MNNCGECRISYAEEGSFNYPGRVDAVDYFCQSFQENRERKNGRGGGCLESFNANQWRIHDFPEVGAPTLRGRGRQHTILPNFPKNA